jgi:hypothetical protein
VSIEKPVVVYFRALLWYFPDTTGSLIWYSQCSILALQECNAGALPVDLNLCLVTCLWHTLLYPVMWAWSPSPVIVSFGASCCNKQRKGRKAKFLLFSLTFHFFDLTVASYRYSSILRSSSEEAGRTRFAAQIELAQLDTWLLAQVKRLRIETQLAKCDSDSAEPKALRFL